MSRISGAFKGKTRKGDIANIIQPQERQIAAKYARYADGRRELVGYIWADSGEQLTPEELLAQKRAFVPSRKLQYRKTGGVKEQGN
jgi:hypothetical protein